VWPPWPPAIAVAFLNCIKNVPSLSPPQSGGLTEGNAYHLRGQLIRREHNLRTNTPNPRRQLLLLRKNFPVDRIDGAIIGSINIPGQCASDGLFEMLGAGAFLPISPDNDADTPFPKR
jgi:hypothetical protein